MRPSKVVPEGAVTRPSKVVRGAKFPSLAFLLLPLLLGLPLLSACSNSTTSTNSPSAPQRADIIFAPTTFHQALHDSSEICLFPATNRVADTARTRINLHANMAISASCVLTNIVQPGKLTYRLNGQEIEMLPFIDCRAETTKGPLRLIAFTLRNREFHPSKAASLRKLEGRKIASHVRRALAETSEDLPLLVLGACFDDPKSNPVRAVSELGFTDLRPVDPSSPGGAVWTRFDPENDSYHRWDYAFASPGLKASASLHRETRSLLIQLGETP